MSAMININFRSGSATGFAIALTLTDCTASLGPEAGVALNTASGLTNITVLPGRVTIATALDAQLNGDLSLSIDWTSGQQPTIELDGLQPSGNDPATATWPTAAGPVTQQLAPGIPLALAGIVSS
jgi:hypothetical protein